MGLCYVCSRNHPLKYCLTFRKMLFVDRYDSVKASGLCMNCFSADHVRSQCTSTKRCEVCGRRHHSMIHRNVSEPGSTSIEETEPTPYVPTPLPRIDPHAPLPTVEVLLGVDLKTVVEQYGQVNFHDLLTGRTSIKVGSANEEIAPLAPEMNRGAVAAPGNEEIAPLAPEVDNPAPQSKRLLATTDPSPRPPCIFGDPYLAPVVSCQLCVGKKTMTVDLLVNPNVPMSHLLFERVNKMPYLTKYKGDLPYGHFKIVTRTGRVLDHWFVIIDRLQSTPEPSKDPRVLTWVTDKSKLAHPEPHIHGPIAGVIGSDLWRRTMYSPAKSFERCPTIWSQESAFGVVIKGRFLRFHRPARENVERTVQPQ